MPSLIDEFYGVDVSTAGGDIDEYLTTSTGRQLLAEDLTARLLEDEGGLYYDPTYGGGLMSFINDDINPRDLPGIESRLCAQLLLDERVINASCKATFNANTKVLHFAFSLEDGLGPFDLILGINSVTADLLMQVG